MPRFRVFDRLASAPGAHVDIDGARNYAKDEGRPLGAGLQEQASNHLKLHRSRAVVVSVNCATKLQRRWREALRSRPTGGGFKPPQAAVVKSHGSER
jgi:hypothetical protein